MCRAGHTVELFAIGESKKPERGNLHLLPSADWEHVFKVERDITKLYGDIIQECDIVHDWSVSGREKIFIDDGKVKRVAIGEFVDSFLDQTGVRDICKSGIKSPTLDANGKISWRPITSVVKHRCMDQIYELQLEHGYKVRLTANHAIYTLKQDGTISTIATKDAKGRYVGISSVVPPSREGMGNLTLDLDGLLADGGHLMLQHHNGKTALPYPLPLEEDLLTFMGLWVADGCYDKCSVNIAVYGDRDIAEFVNSFASKHNIHVNVNGGGYRLQSVLLQKVMKRLGFTGNVYSKSIPNWIFNLKIEQIRAFLKGYYSGDGWLTQGRTVGISSVSNILVDDIRSLLLMCGIFTSKTNRKGGRRHIKRRGRVEEITHAPSYILYASGEDAGSFMQDIGFIQKWRKLIPARVHASKIHGIPLLNIISKRCVDSASFKKNNKVSRGKLRKYYSNLGTSPKANHSWSPLWKERLLRLAETDIIWLKVLDVKPVEKEEFVYDIEIDNTHKFFASNILVHNTLTKMVHHWLMLGSKRVVQTPWGTGAPPPFYHDKIANTVCWSSFQRDLFLQQGYPESTKYVHGAVEPSMFQVGKGDGNYILYLSRCHPSKHHEIAIALAKKMGFNLVISCDTESPDHIYYLQQAQRVLTKGMENVEFVIDPTYEQKEFLYSNAKAFILPSESECFGLVVIEALAHGCPVILRNDGAYPEIIEHGLQGFLCDNMDDYENAIKSVDAIDRRESRKLVEEKFSTDGMARQYGEIYEEVLQGRNF